MPITKQKKVEIVEKLKKAVTGAASLVFVNFRGLNVAESTKLRKALTGKKIGYTVAKKTLLKRALADGKVEGEIPPLEGEIAFAYGDDSLLPAREIYAFQRTNPEMIKIVGGVFEGKYMDSVAMMEIATIPPREVLYGQLVGLLASPIRGFAVVLNEIAKTRA